MLRFLPSFPGFGITAAIDILVVAFLIYQAMMALRGTRAAHIISGIIIMVSLYGLASWAGLQTLRTLLAFIVPYLGLAMIVLFQSEARRALARLGRKRWLPWSSAYWKPESVNEIILAVEELSANKTGALIVLERDIGLRTFIESGVRLESRISRDLLLSVFQVGLPLHDGAVIVQKDRIAAAACFLPLTTSRDFSRRLGTRHRAAIGITEETDCVSIIVSEETGRISMASYGDIAQGLSPSELLERINRHFEVKRPTTMQIDEFPADIPLAQAQEHDRRPGEGIEP